MKVALAQVNTKIGDFDANKERVLKYTRQAKLQGADLVVFPELALSGYPPEDLLYEHGFLRAEERCLAELSENLESDIGVVFGHISVAQQERGKSLHNSLSLIYNKKILHTQHKSLLPSYDVFDEHRYFEAATEQLCISFMGHNLGLLICEDIWFADSKYSQHYYDPIKKLKEQDVEILIVASASPFQIAKYAQRLRLVQNIKRKTCYVNLVGANGPIIFDGNSFAVNEQGKVLRQLPAFTEALALVDFAPHPASEAHRDRSFAASIDSYEWIEKALVLGIRDYVQKTKFKRVHLGLSGGIDSALVAYLAWKACGAENISLYALPSRYSSEHSLSDANKLAQNLGIRLQELAIEPIFASYLQSLEPIFKGYARDLTEENLQARIRGSLLMAISNKFNSLLLTTGNKSELATGYATLYGDMCGALAVIGDLLKTEVFALCKFINRNKELIPQNIIDKAPSAELSFNQKDEDSLPPYEILDRIIRAYVVEGLGVADLVEQGLERDLVVDMLELIQKQEHKRFQGAPVLKISAKSFGTGRRIPLVRSLQF